MYGIVRYGIIILQNTKHSVVPKVKVKKVKLRLHTELLISFSVCLYNIILEVQYNSYTQTQAFNIPLERHRDRDRSFKCFFKVISLVY